MRVKYLINDETTPVAPVELRTIRTLGGVIEHQYHHLESWRTYCILNTDGTCRILPLDGALVSSMMVIQSVTLDKC